MTVTGGGGQKIRKFCGRHIWKPPNALNSCVAVADRVSALSEFAFSLQLARIGPDGGREAQHIRTAAAAAEKSFHRINVCKNARRAINTSG